MESGSRGIFEEATTAKEADCLPPAVAKQFSAKILCWPCDMTRRAAGRGAGSDGGEPMEGECEDDDCDDGVAKVHECWL